MDSVADMPLPFKAGTIVQVLFYIFVQRLWLMPAYLSLAMELNRLTGVELNCQSVKACGEEISRGSLLPGPSMMDWKRQQSIEIDFEPLIRASLVTMKNIWLNKRLCAG